ncbi:MAG: sialate O-acetylesterase [Bacteroidales bacterium]|nr:sialate O-acetylesterase [Bacteroidales bacterium]
MYLSKAIAGFLLIMGTLTAGAQAVLPAFISDGMVLQREIEIPVWGWASPGEKVEIEFRGKTYNTTAGPDRKWSISIDPTSAGGPYIMTIRASNTLALNDILIGDVWLCSGQSNMQYEMYKSREIYEAEIAASANDMIRQFKVKRRIGFNPTVDVETDNGWQAADPETVLNFTAVGYFFAKNLYDKYEVPVGLINCSYGGTPAEAWMNEEALKKYPHYYSKAIEFRDSALVDSITRRDRQYAEEWNRHVAENDMGLREMWYLEGINAGAWSIMPVPNFWNDFGLKEVEGGVVWFRKEIEIPAAMEGKDALLRLGNIVSKDVTYFNGVKVGNTTNKNDARKYIVDGSLVRAGKNIITIRVLNEYGEGGFIRDKPYTLEIGDLLIDLRGDWHYKMSVSTKPLRREDATRFQDAGSSMYHGMLEPLIGYAIKGVIWYQGESNVSRATEYRILFPDLIKNWREEWGQGDFPFLFVQLANKNVVKTVPGESNLASLQEAQAMALSLPNTGMAVANDIGEWNDVHPLNKSDVGYRLSLAARKVAYGEDLVYSGPTYESMQIAGDTIIISFSNKGSGLTVKGGGELKHFSIAGEDKNFVWAEARIEGDKVIVWNKNVVSPAAVRYAWADNPAGANLYNKEGLPASCFRTDQ